MKKLTSLFLAFSLFAFIFVSITAKAQIYLDSTASVNDRVEDLLLVESARDHGIIDRIVLVGRKDRIAAAVLGNLNGFRLERDALA